MSNMVAVLGAGVGVASLSAVVTFTGRLASVAESELSSDMASSALEDIPPSKMKTIKNVRIVFVMVTILSLY